jgi:hypothetical protein
MDAPGENAKAQAGRGRKWRKAGTIAGRVLLILIGLFWWFYLRDDAAPDDADMQVSHVQIPNEENGMVQLAKLPEQPLNFYAFAEAHGVDSMTAGSIFVGVARNDTLVDAFLAAGAAELRQADAILALPHFDAAALVVSKPQDFAMEYGELGRGSVLAKVWHMRAVRCVQIGDYAGATGDVLRIHRLAQRFGEGSDSLMHAMTALIIAGIANTAAVELFDSRALPDQDLARLAQAWRQETPWPEIFRRSLAGEYQHISKTMEVLTAEDYYLSNQAAVHQLNQVTDRIGGWQHYKESAWARFWSIWLYYGLQPNTTRCLILEEIRPAQRVLEGTYATRPSLPSYAFFSKMVGVALRRGEPNFIGRETASDLGSLLGGVAGSGFRVMAQERLLRSGLALRQYYNEHQALPAKLADLVPQYLKAVPEDPFDGQPLRYDPERRILYVVGKELTDRHGSKFVGQAVSALGDNDPWEDDHQPTLELKFAAKAGP